MTPFTPAPSVAFSPAAQADGIHYDPSGTAVTLVLFAPGKRSVHVLGAFNGWEPRPEFLMQKTPDGRRFWLRLDGLTPGEEVPFQYFVDEAIAVGDPYCEKILDRRFDPGIPATTHPHLPPFPPNARGNVVSVLHPGKSTYTWQAADFQRPAPEKLLIYELLVRDFTAAGNFQSLTQAVAHLRQLGVNAVQLLPVQEFTANDSWGYNPTYYFAPDKAYGPAHELKRFVDECHRAGIAVLLDVVFNHADCEFPYVKLYWDGKKPSADSPMFNPRDRHPYGVFYDVNHDSELTQTYFGRVLEHWLTEYRVDGFRLDLSKGFTQKKTNTDEEFRRYDAGRVAHLKRFCDAIRAVDQTAFVILEHFADDREEQELTDHGMMVWGNLNGEFRKLMNGKSADLSRLSHHARGFSRPALVGYAESHDEERLVFDALQNKAFGLGTALERAKAVAALLLLTPGPKLLWQFGELGYDVGINDNGRTGRKPQKWEYLRDPERSKLFKVYATLARLKQALPIFQTPDFALTNQGGLQRLVLVDPENPASLLTVVANFGPQSLTDAEPFSWQTPSGRKTPATLHDFFSGETLEAVAVAGRSLTYQPGEFHVFSTEKWPAPEAGLVPWTLHPAAALPEPSPAGAWLTVYPNPTQETLILELESAYRGEVTLEISDVSGRRINHFQPRKVSEKLVQHLPIRELPRGLYLLQIAEGEQRKVEKFVKE